MDEKEREAIVYVLKEEEKIGDKSIVNVKYAFNNNELSFKQMLSEVENSSDLGEEILSTIAKKARQDLWDLVEKEPGIRGNLSNELLEETTIDEYCSEVIKRMKNPDKKTGMIGGRWEPTYKEFVEDLIQKGDGMQAIYAIAFYEFKS